MIIRSNPQGIKIPKIQIIERDIWLLERCQNKKVLHLGCTDYPVTQSKFNQQQLLHPKLCTVAHQVIGIDNNQSGIELMSKLMPKEVLIVHDAENLENCTAIHNQQFDVIVAADILEHLSNIGLFLNGVRSLLHAHNRLLLTTPQAFSIKRFLPMLFLGWEHVHQDHIAYFSVSTLSSLLSRYGLEIEEVYSFQWRASHWLNKFANAIVTPILWVSAGHLCDELALVVKLAKEQHN